jgi:hypothetical protein
MLLLARRHLDERWDVRTAGDKVLKSPKRLINDWKRHIIEMRRQVRKWEKTT